jgi:hypothetical protein
MVKLLYFFIKFQAMKTSFFFTLICALCLTAMAQAPQAFKYQAVARNTSGEVLVSKSVMFKISILQGSVSGPVVYSELHSRTTNGFGLVDLEIGNGTFQSGTFLGINWGVSTYFVKVEMDPAGGIAFQTMGTSQLLSVPYALYAKDVQNKAVLTDATLSGDGSTANPLKIPDSAITSAKILDGTVANADLAPNSVDAGKIADLAVGTAELANLGVTNTKIADGAVTNAKLAASSVFPTNISSKGALTNTVILFDGLDVSWGGAPGSLVRVSQINVTCSSLASFSSTYVKIADLGTFTKVEATSTVHVTYEGRITANTISGTGAHFELRVDDAPVAVGRARANIRLSEAGASGIPVSITGIFTGLGTGSHTVSMWIKGSTSGTTAMVDPGCWTDDHVIAKEFR